MLFTGHRVEAAAQAAAHFAGKDGLEKLAAERPGGLQFRASQAANPAARTAHAQHEVFQFQI